MNSRIPWNEYGLLLAWISSQRSEALTTLQDGTEVSRKVGCCVLAKETNRILSLGYNGFPMGFKPPPDFFKDPVKRFTHIIHAECNSLTTVKRGEARLIATTLSPCACCAQQIIAREIPTVVYGEISSHVEGIDILQFYGVEVVYIPMTKVLEEWAIPALGESLGD
jgi:deoxycytidylate deaminase